ncbi:hypothetical protein A1507_08670 [Methylomonas koyamae]|uniref:Uncharacterized protein n=1 Tax=Methylomonas koyamae TaxID=702114 RepID=A0A177NN35_9GAMM|nr:hypothetical protein A1507_08670 [Methylomonas koyamae]
MNVRSDFPEWFFIVLLEVPFFSGFKISCLPNIERLFVAGINQNISSINIPFIMLRYGYKFEFKVNIGSFSYFISIPFNCIF